MFSKTFDQIKKTHLPKSAVALALFCLVISCGKTDGVAGKAKVIFTRVFAGGNHSCGLLADNRLMCWGYNLHGQLGLGFRNDIGDDPDDFKRTDIFVDLGAGRTIKSLALGGSHTCAILDNDSVKCWGYNFFGQLGLGDTNNRGDAANEMGDNLSTVSLGTGRTAKAIAVGSLHTCVILDNDSVKCWGYNVYGQLGQESTSQLGDGANEMGDNLPAVNLGVGRTAKAIATGANSTCAILDNDTLKCWGANTYGGLGQGNTNSLGDGAGEMAALAAIDLGTGRTASKVSVGTYHTCAILDNGSVKCWGGNTYGALGFGSFSSVGGSAGEMGDNLAAVDLGTGRTATGIALQQDATCALLDNATVKCWGYNTLGNLGRENSDHIGYTSGQMGDNLSAINLGTGRTVTSLAVGTSHACAYLDNLMIKCWGYNVTAQLGLGDTAPRGDLVNSMGDNLPYVNEENLKN